MSAKTNTDEYRRDAAYLPPPGGPGPPQPVTEAAEAVRRAGLAVKDAIAKRDRAVAAAQAAPAVDQAADQRALEAGEDPPPATGPSAELEKHAALRRLDAARDVHRRAHRRLEWALREHGAEYAESLREHLVREREEVLALFDGFVEKCRAMEAHSYAAAQARRHQTGPVGDYSRSLRATEKGLDARLAGLLDPVRERIDALVPIAQSVLDAEQAEREQRAEQNARMAKMARGGVFVPGGEW